MLFSFICFAMFTHTRGLCYGFRLARVCVDVTTWYQSLGSPSCIEPRIVKLIRVSNTPSQYSHCMSVVIAMSNYVLLQETLGWQGQFITLTLGKLAVVPCISLMRNTKGCRKCVVTLERIGKLYRRNDAWIRRRGDS